MIRNLKVRERLGVAPLSATLVESLSWFRHVKRKTVDTPVRMAEWLIVEGKRCQGRLKRT